MVMLTYNPSPLGSEAGRRIASVLKAAWAAQQVLSQSGLHKQDPALSRSQTGKKRKKKEREEGRKEEKRREFPLPLFHLLNCQLPTRCVAQSQWVVCLSGMHETMGSVPSVVQNSIGCLIRRHCR